MVISILSDRGKSPSMIGFQAAIKDCVYLFGCPPAASADTALLQAHHLK